MSIKTAFTNHPDPQAAASDLKRQLAEFSPRFLVYFAAPSYAASAVGDALKAVFDAPSIGCTTAGEFAGGKILENSLVLLALDEAHVEQVAVARVTDTHDDDEVRAAYHSLVKQLGPIQEADYERTVGLVLHDGMAGAEEKVMSTLSTLSNVPFVGGSAGDDGRHQKTQVFVGYEARGGGVALALLKLKTPYLILKTQSFDITDKPLEVTRANEAERTVLEFNGEPAVKEYARVLGVAENDIAQSFMDHPLGLLVGGEPYVRSPQRVEGESIRFYCNIKEGMQLKLLSTRNIVHDTKRDLERALETFGPVQGLVNFNCIQRTIQLKQVGLAEAYAALFEPYQSIGFSTYGESYIGHINQTSVILLFS